MTIETAMAETPSAGSGAWTLQAFLGEIEHFGTHTALLAVKGGAVESWTFADLANCARRLAGGLLREGVGPGEPVLLLGRGRPDWVVVRPALRAVGALAVPRPEERRVGKKGGSRCRHGWEA